MLGRFNKIFGIQETLPVVQSRFVQRINQTAFHNIDKMFFVHYKVIFEQVCYWLGVNAIDRISIANINSFGRQLDIPPLRSLTNDEFIPTLQVLVLLHQYYDGHPKEQKEISDSVADALSSAAIDLGVKWNDGMFYPSGANELDEKLVEEPLEWLADFPAERIDYMKALTGYTNNRLDEVVGNCYLTIEGLARNVLNNGKVLENNRDELIAKIGLSQEWKSLLKNFVNYANEFRRHASENRHNIKPAEAEAFLYMTGLLVRLIIETINS